jgi:23S rRNA pseudouridine1911/1915/1917 synthase
MNRKVTAVPEELGLRLDTFLAKGSLAPSRSFASKLILAGKVNVNGKPEKASYRINTADLVEVDFPDVPGQTGLRAESVELKVVFEDDDMLVIDKPKGLTVHPGAGRSTGTLVNALLGRLGGLSSIGGIARPGIVHRLDKDTSGLMVVAKNDKAHIKLASDLSARKMGRTYRAIVRGGFSEESGRIDVPLGRSSRDRKRMAARPEGRSAVTLFKVLERFAGYSLLELRLQTGRTHQIRVHLSYIGHPVAGDLQYGGQAGELGLSSQALHAVKLELTHPSDGRAMVFESEPGIEFQKALSKLRECHGGVRDGR